MVVVGLGGFVCFSLGFVVVYVVLCVVCFFILWCLGLWFDGFVCLFVLFCLIG